GLGALAVSSTGVPVVRVDTGTLEINGSILGGTLAKFGTGAVTLSGGVANTSNVNLNEGTITLNKSGGVSAAATITVGDDVGANDSDLLIVSDSAAQLIGAASIASTGRINIGSQNLTLNAAGLVTMLLGSDRSADIGSISSSTGQLVLGTAGLTLTTPNA